MGDALTGLVECHSGYAYAERPIAFYWEGERLEVSTVESSWRSPAGRYFRVLSSAGSRFELIYNEADDAWEIRLIG